MPKLYATIAASLAAIFLATGAYFIYVGSRAETCSSSAVAGGGAEIGGPFELVDGSGNLVRDTDVIEDLTLVYFGFTYCPDVCPLDTARNAEVIDILDADGLTVKPVMISIDPERDTPQVMADYVSVIHPRMVGLTGSAAQVEAASKAYKTYYRKNGQGEDYLIDHTTFSYLMSPDGFIDFYRRDTPPAEVAKSIACHARQTNG